MADLEKNQQSRIWYVKHWVKNMLKLSDEEWSRQQNILINSAIENARGFRFSPEFYLKTKNELYKLKR